MASPALSPLPLPGQTASVFAVYIYQQWWDYDTRSYIAEWGIARNRNSYCIYPKMDSARRGLAGMGFDTKNPQPNNAYRHKSRQGVEAVVVEFQNVDV